MNDSPYTDEMIDACACAAWGASIASAGGYPGAWAKLDRSVRTAWREVACSILSGKQRAKDDYLAHDVVIAVARAMGWPRREP